MSGRAPEHEETRDSGRSSVSLEGLLHRTARAAVVLVRKKSGRTYSMKQFIEEAVTAQIRYIADTYNGGRPILPIQTPLSAGRPKGVMHRASPPDPDAPTASRSPK